MSRYAALLGTGGYLPDTVLTNEQISQTIETTNEWIVERTGIRERRIAAKHETASSMAEQAARQALDAQFRRLDIGCVPVRPASNATSQYVGCVGKL